MIKKIEVKTLGKNKIGWRFDMKRRLYITFQVDTTFNGSRHVRRGFPSKKAALDYLEELKTQDRLIKIGYVKTLEKIENENKNL